MAWNKPTESKKKSTPKKSALDSVILWAGLIAAIGLCALFFLAGDDEETTPRVKKNVVSVKNVKPSSRVQDSQTPPRKATHPRKIRVSEKTPERELPVLSASHTNDAALYRKPLPFRNVTEQALLHLFSTPVGLIPFPTGMIPAEECQDIVNILATPTHATDKDDDLTASQKELINAAKKEMAAFIGDGGTPNEFIDHYRKELMKAWMIRADAEAEIDRIAREEDPSLAKEMIQRVNEMLRDQGIVELQDNIEVEEEEL